MRRTSFFRSVESGKEKGGGNRFRWHDERDHHASPIEQPPRLAASPRRSRPSNPTNREHARDPRDPLRSPARAEPSRHEKTQPLFSLSLLLLSLSLSLSLSHFLRTVFPAARLLLCGSRRFSARTALVAPPLPPWPRPRPRPSLGSSSTPPPRPSVSFFFLVSIPP